MLYSNFFIEQQ